VTSTQTERRIPVTAARQGLRLLVLDTAFSLEAIRERGLEASVTCRDLGGFFEHVWSVHPFATLVTSDAWGPREGAPATYEIAPRHTVIEGRVARSRALDRLPALNFLVAQLDVLFRLIVLIRRERINVIRAGDPLYLGLLGWLCGRLCGVPVLVRVGGNNDKVFATTGRPLMPRLFRTRRVEKVVERFVLSHADAVAGANVDNLNFALANGARPERSTLFRYGNLIDPRHFTAPAKRPPAQSDLDEFQAVSGRYLMYIGRLEPVKHADDVVRVLARVRESGHDMTALLVGNGRMREDLERLAEELGVARYVAFAGNRDQGWLARVIPAAAVLLSPHTGRALAEAGLGAAPVVAYDVDWQAEAIESGKTGELVRFGDWQAMADRTVALLRDRARAHELGAALRERVLGMMDPERLDEHERDTYRALLQRSPV
jgi:glycosyltransferase involved in cell wall biosynthesis